MNMDAYYSAFAKADKLDREQGAIGFDGSQLRKGDRVEIHPGTDLWMRGARYGTIVSLSLTTGDKVHVKMDKLPKRKFSGPADLFRTI